MRFLRLIIFSFFILQFSFLLQAIDPPTLVWPKNDMIVHKNHLLFQWNTVVGAENYELQLASDEQFINIFWEKSTVENEIDSLFQDFNYGEYFWRVRAVDINVTYSQWSSVNTFEFFNSKALDVLAF